jgi:hypothetical protein
MWKERQRNQSQQADSENQASSETRTNNLYASWRQSKK